MKQIVYLSIIIIIVVISINSNAFSFAVDDRKILNSNKDNGNKNIFTDQNNTTNTLDIIDLLCMWLVNRQV
jgi:hypothetical protein